MPASSSASSKQLPGRPDERAARLVLLVARLLADEHHLGARRALAEDDLRPGLPEVAGLAAGRFLPQLRQARHVGGLRERESVAATSVSEQTAKSKDEPDCEPGPRVQTVAALLEPRDEETETPGSGEQPERRAPNGLARRHPRAPPARAARSRAVRARRRRAQARSRRAPRPRTRHSRRGGRGEPPSPTMIARRAKLRCAPRRRGRVVRQRPAKPRTPVRFWSAPLVR